MIFLYLLVYVILFLPRINGAGQFWDNVFPYFSSHIGNYFWFNAYSWTNLVDFGQPLGYSSNYFFRFCISSLRWLNPETLFFLFYLCIFSVGSYGVYLLLKERTSKVIAVLLGAAAFFNPAIIYKLNSGHIDYFVSYVVCIYLLVFLLNYFQPTFKHYVILGLFVAASGIQIQFFIFTGFIVGTYFLFFPDQFRWKYLPIIVAIPLGTHLVWLMNFLIGGSTATDVGASAAKQKFDASALTTHLNLFTFKFSKATSLFRIYTQGESLLFFALFILSLTTLFLKQKSRRYFFFISCLLLFLFLGTGSYQQFELWPISFLYPMFRESGHFAPLIVLFTLLLLGNIQNARLRHITIIILLFTIGITFGKFQQNAHALNVAVARDQFREFVDFASSHQMQGRVLTYPFFGQYAFLGQSSRIRDGFRLDNTGYDSFMKYAGIPYVNNSVPAIKTQDSLQFTFAKTLNLKPLALAGIEYLFDFSKIYESYFEKYVPENIYEGKIELIKNNPEFFSQIAQANPNEIEQVSPHIYKILNAKPQISAFTRLFAFDRPTLRDTKTNFIQTHWPDPVYFILSQAGTDARHTTEIVVPFEELQFTSTSNSNALTTTVTFDTKKQNLLHTVQNTDGSIHVNDTPIQATAPTTTPLTQATTTLTYVNTYSFSNLIPNGSFESGTWQTTVKDCSNYDSNPVIGMKLDREQKSEGEQALALTVTRHAACTSLKIPVKAFGRYHFQFDYQSDTAPIASYYLEFNNTKKTSINERLPISNAEWQTSSQTLVAPEGATQLTVYFYARETNAKTAIINRYDNVQLIEAPDLTGTYILTSEPMQTLRVPSSITFNRIDPTAVMVQVTSATTPFFIAFTENYHPQWKLRIQNTHIPESAHHKLNAFMNAWYIDTHELCSIKQLCQLNADGSYHITLLIEFAPQRWFKFALLTSLTTLIACVCYLIKYRKIT